MIVDVSSVLPLPFCGGGHRDRSVCVPCLQAELYSDRYGVQRNTGESDSGREICKQAISLTEIFGKHIHIKIQKTPILVYLSTIAPENQRLCT